MAFICIDDDNQTVTAEQTNSAILFHKALTENSATENQQPSLTLYF